jgi:elongation factor 1-gamma
VQLKVQNVTWDDKNRDSVKKNSATATLPYLETSKGNISEAFAIIQFLVGSSNPALLGNGAWEKSQVDQWVDFAQMDLGKNNFAAVYHLFGWTEYNKEKSDAALKDIKDHLTVLNNHLSGEDFIVGNSYTLADLELFYILKNYWQYIFVEEIRKNQFRNISSWFAKLMSNAHIQAAYGRILLCKAPQKTPKVEAKKEAKKAEKTEAPAAKSEKPKATEGDDEDKSAKKKVNPLDLLAPSAFVFDDFKREFMNSKDRASVMVDFWKKFDANGYSLWTMKYDKLPSEGKILFRTRNSLSFFLQKLDCFRKYSFGAHGIYGVEGDYEIQGCWMWRGTEIPEEVIFISIFLI